MQEKETRVLCVGNAVVDFMNIVDEYPAEDSEQIGLRYYWQRGGNATNNCTVLSTLKTPCEFMGVLPTQGAEASWLQEDFHKAGIPIDHCLKVSGQCPISTSIINTGSGSRTILVFPRDCPELTHSQFREKLKADFNAYSWVHFELRTQTKEVVAMMRDVLDYNKGLQETRQPPIILSVEIENPSTPLPELAMVEADFIFVSKVFATSRGCRDIRQALEDLYVHCRPGSVLVCAWGDQGAGIRCEDDRVVSPADTNVKVVDSLGAGDTFTAGFISSILKQKSTLQPSYDSSKLRKNALDFACRLAAYKCSIFGFQGLESFNFIQ